MELENYKSNEPCVACKESRDGYVCYHHLVTQKNLGPDEKWNFLSLCLIHHTEIHKIGLNKFLTKYDSEDNPKIKMSLIENGWEFCTLRGKWFHPITQEVSHVS